MRNASMQRYLDQYRSTHSDAEKIQRLLSYMDRYEQQNHVSFGEMDIDEFIKYIESRKYKSIDSIKNEVWAISKYLRDSGFYDVTKDVELTDVSISAINQDGLFKSYEELYNRISCYRLPEEGWAIFPYSIFAWMGIPKERASLVKTDDVDLTHGILQTDYPLTFERLSPLMCDVLRRFMTTNRVQRENRKYKHPHKTEYFVFRMVGDQDPKEKIPMGISDVTSAFVDVRNKMREASAGEAASRIKFQYSDIVRSGKFRKMYDMECVWTDIYSASSQHLLKQLWGEGAKLPNVLSAYEMYKKAFDLK